MFLKIVRTLMVLQNNIQTVLLDIYLFKYVGIKKIIKNNHFIVLKIVRLLDDVYIDVDECR